MARGAAQAQRKRQETRPKKKQAAPSWEEQLFFSRLRRHAKVVYVLLAVVFALGFVVLGVGSGSTGIGDILRGNFFGGGGSSVGSRIKDDQKKLAKNPSNVAVSLDLATLYQQKQNTAAAIATLERANKAKPKNLDVLNRLAGIYRGQAEQAQTEAANAQAALAASSATPPGLDVNSTLGQAFASDPLSQSLKTKATDAYTKMGTAFSKSESAYRRVATAARGTAEEANAQLALAGVARDTLQVTGQPADAQLALKAYRRYLKLEPNGVQANLARQTIAQIEAILPKKGRH
jgi:tetratricopeptide (TPR) repeat protein